MKVAVIGTGAYSLGIALMLAKHKNNNIMLWTENSKRKDEFNQTHQIKSIFENVTFPSNIYMTDDIEEALKNAKLIFLITAVKYVKEICLKMKEYYYDIPICIASKGINNDTLETVDKVVKKTLNTKKICAISGPTFAIDLINNEPVALAIAGDKKSRELVIKNLTGDTLKLRETNDIIGIELCGSIKNVFAISAGMLKGLGYHESTQAFLINEAIHDMKQIISSLGGKKKTILSFAGLGDLLLTCTTTKSRNYTFGFLIGSSNDKNEWINYLNNNTVEGYYTLYSLKKILDQKNINIPLITILYEIIEGMKKPKELGEFLIKKP